LSNSNESPGTDGAILGLGQSLVLISEKSPFHFKMRDIEFARNMPFENEMVPLPFWH